jgi:hypothetical protein
LSTQLKGDDRLVVLFKHLAVKNQGKSDEAGRLICDDIEVCEIRAGGSRNVAVFPAMAVSHWSGDQYGGEQVKVTYAERFRHQYQQFKAEQAQTISGTPLVTAPFLTEARKAELRAQNLYTVEQLAAIEGAELKNLGPGGREMKNAAIEYIDTSRENAPNLRAMAELEQMRARNALLEEDMKLLKERAAVAQVNAEDPEFAAMSLDQLREMIAANTGHAPRGNADRKTLVRMAKDSQTTKAA